MRLIDGDALMERLGIAYDCRECDQDKPPYCTWKPDAVDVCQIISDAPSIEPEQHEIGYFECANAMLKMWVDNVLTDGEYNRIMDKLNAHWEERREE